MENGSRFRRCVESVPGILELFRQFMVVTHFKQTAMQISEIAVSIVYMEVMEMRKITGGNGLFCVLDLIGFELVYPEKRLQVYYIWLKSFSRFKTNEPVRCKWGQQDPLIMTNSTGTEFEGPLA